MNSTELILSRIETLRTYKGLNNTKKITPYQISKNANFNPSTLNNLLSGNKKDLRLSTLFKICEGLNISVRDFFQSEEFEKEKNCN